MQKRCVNNVLRDSFDFLKCCIVNQAFIHICIFFNHKQIFTLCMVLLFTGIALYASGLAVLATRTARPKRGSLRNSYFAFFFFFGGGGEALFGISGKSCYKGLKVSLIIMPA